MYVVIDEKIPHLTGQESPLGWGPGLGFLPKVDFGKESPKYYTLNISSYKTYAEASQNILSNYWKNSSNCNFVSGKRLHGTYHEPCNFPSNLLGPCQNPQLLPYNERLCIYLKMNKVTSIPPKVIELCKIFGYFPDINSSKILIDCFVAKGDPEDFSRSITFYPSTDYNNKTLGYFSTVAFPYLNQKSFQSPLLAINIRTPKETTLYKCKYENMEINEEYRFVLSV